MAPCRGHGQEYETGLPHEAMIPLLFAGEDSEHTAQGQWLWPQGDKALCHENDIYYRRVLWQW